MFTTANDLIKLSTDNIVQLIKGNFLIPPRKWKKVQNILVALYYSSKTKSNFYGCSQSKENGRFVILSTHPKQRPSQSKENGRFVILSTHPKQRPSQSKENGRPPQQARQLHTLMRQTGSGGSSVTCIKLQNSAFSMH